MNLDIETLSAPAPAEPEPAGPLLVIAGTPAEFRAFCLDENLRPGRDAVFINREEQLRARDNFRWCEYGTAGSNWRTRGLCAMAESRPGAVYVYIPSKRDEREPLRVVAGNLRQFQDLCWRANLRPGVDAVYVNRPESLWGKRAFRWCVYGTEPGNWREIERALAGCEAVQVGAPGGAR